MCLIFLLGVDYLLNVVILKGKELTFPTTINKGTMGVEEHTPTITQLSLLLSMPHLLSLYGLHNCSVNYAYNTLPASS